MTHGKTTHSGRGIAAHAAVAALALGLVGVPTAFAGGAPNGPIGGETHFNLDLPEGVALKATKGAIKQGPSNVVMENGWGRFDAASGTGRIRLIGGLNFKFDHNRGPTGDFELKYGEGGKLRGRIVGKPTNLIKVRGGRVEQVEPGVTRVEDARLKLTTKGARRLNAAVDARADAPFEEGKFGRVTSIVDLNR
jgi:hypothetical protein